VSSLSYSHLVSAAGGVYKSCLKDMDADDWSTVFMPLIVEVLSGRDVIRYAILCRWLKMKCLFLVLTVHVMCPK
jgi:hypothetical protein